MKALLTLVIASVLSVGTASAAQSDRFVPMAAAPSQAQPASQADNAKPCLAVKDAGSHAFRNIMLAGVAGALISKKQYQVVNVIDYPATPGQKFHGNDLQTLQTGGVKVVILSKNYTADDLQRSCR